MSLWTVGHTCSLTWLVYPSLVSPALSLVTVQGWRLGWAGMNDTLFDVFSIHSRLVPGACNCCDHQQAMNWNPYTATAVSLLTCMALPNALHLQLGQGGTGNIKDPSTISSINLGKHAS